MSKAAPANEAEAKFWEFCDRLDAQHEAERLSTQSLNFHCKVAAQGLEVSVNCALDARTPTTQQQGFDLLNRVASRVQKVIQEELDRVTA